MNPESSFKASPLFNILMKRQMQGGFTEPTGPEPKQQNLNPPLPKMRPPIQRPRRMNEVRMRTPHIRP